MRKFYKNTAIEYAPAIGFTQISGVTYPCIANHEADNFGYRFAATIIDRRLSLVSIVKFYPMSRYEFYKWFHWTPLDYLIDWHSENYFTVSYNDDTIRLINANHDTIRRFNNVANNYIT